MLKTTVLSQVFIANEMLIANEIGGVENNDKLIEKSGNCLKTGKLSKGLKLSKSRNSKSKKLAKSKKPLKSEDLPNFNVKKDRPSFLILEAKTTFNYLWLAFTKALIL